MKYNELSIAALEQYLVSVATVTAPTILVWGRKRGEQSGAPIQRTNIHNGTKPLGCKYINGSVYITCL
jgi:hypothetical protein